MRINRLDLARYGHFTDHSFEFAAPVTGLPDFHIIYGPNETGKSTTLAAILDLLFGIEVRSKYGFLHPYPTMRIGAELEIGGSPHQFVRIKQRQNDLLDGTEKPILDGVMLGSLGNVDRAAYTTMFCLDDDSLEGGGESILKSEGDLGQLLFSASTGLSDLSNKLDDLKAEADRFYKFRARGGTLFDLKSDLNHQKAKSDALDTGASEYAKLA